MVNLDPAADPGEYEFTVDIRDLISLEDVMQEMSFGPNGGLLYCFEYAFIYLLSVIRCSGNIGLMRSLCCRFLMSHLDWLDEEIGDYEDEYLIFDCPGTSFDCRADLRENPLI